MKYLRWFLLYVRTWLRVRRNLRCARWARSVGLNGYASKFVALALNDIEQLKRKRPVAGRGP